MADKKSPEGRRHPRVAVKHSAPMEVNLDGQPHFLVVSDISEGGIGFIVPPGTTVNTDDIMAIGIEQVINLRGRVRWVGPAGEQDGGTRLGIEFESISVQPKSGEEIQDMVDAWMNISHTYNVFDGFLHIADLIDNDIIDGNIVEFSDAMIGITMWMEQQIGAINLWQAITTDKGNVEVHLLVESHVAKGAEQRPAHEERVHAVAVKQVTQWFDEMPYIYSENLVIECLEKFDGKTDLLHKLANVLGKRTRIWTKLLIKNIALKLLGEEVERYRSLDGD